MVTQNVEVIRLDEGIHYTTAEHFSRNLYRHLRFHYPTYMFDEPAFEIDENGDPSAPVSATPSVCSADGTSSARCW